LEISEFCTLQVSTKAQGMISTHYKANCCKGVLGICSAPIVFGTADCDMFIEALEIALLLKMVWQSDTHFLVHPVLNVCKWSF
jgi:hypothetical protein